MKPQEILVNFMRYKQNCMPKMRWKYLTKPIEKDLLSWDEKESQKIVDTLITKIEIFDSQCINILREELCPYCIKKTSCTDCFYGKQRGFCVINSSTYRKILKQIRKKTKRGYLKAPTKDLIAILKGEKIE